MLRSIVLGLGVLALAAALVVLVLGGPLPIALWLGVAGAMLTAGLIHERVHYKSLAARRPGPGWQRTAERFIDPESGKTVTVYVRPVDGERMYVAE